STLSCATVAGAALIVWACAGRAVHNAAKQAAVMRHAAKRLSFGRSIRLMSANMYVLHSNLSLSGSIYDVRANSPPDIVNLRCAEWPLLMWDSSVTASRQNQKFAGTTTRCSVG